VEELPGKPDFRFPSAELVVFVHGCFWHGHSRCRKGRSRPKSNRRYWRAKIDRNQRRDRRTVQQLRRMGYGAFTIWECELRARKIPARLAGRLGVAQHHGS
jgi:DNA mismatch endonuclease (patch repair protein)